MLCVENSCYIYTDWNQKLSYFLPPFEERMALFYVWRDILDKRELCGDAAAVAIDNDVQ